MNQRVLLTGATGFVGRQVLKQLLARNYKVRVVIRKGILPLGTSVDIDSVIRTEDLFAESISWWLDALKNIDVVIHAAWYAEPGKYLVSEKNIDCMVGTITMSRAASFAKLSRFIGIGTCFEYNFIDQPLLTSSPLNPTTLYAATKASTFFTLNQLFESTQTQFSWARLFYLYGEGEDSRRLVASLHQKLQKAELVALTKGDQVRDFMEISEAAGKIVDLIESPQVGPVNICTGKQTSVRQMAEDIANQYGRRDLLRFGEYPENLTDPPFVVGVPSL